MKYTLGNKIGSGKVGREIDQKLKLPYHFVSFVFANDFLFLSNFFNFFFDS